VADNVTLNAGTGGDVVAADDIGPGVKYQRVKITLGADGTNDGDVASGNPLPVSLPSIPAGSNNIGDVDVLSIAAGDNNIGNVDIVTMPNVTLAAGTNTNEVVGDVAHDVAIAGNPVTIGARASAAAPTDVDADNDAVRLWSLRNGALAVQPTASGTIIAAGNGTAATAQRVTIASDSTGQVAVASLPSIPAGSNNIGDVDVLSLPAIPAGTNNIGDVDVLTLPALVAGTAYVGKVRLTDGTLDATLVDETGASAVDVLGVGGGTPHDSVDSGNPLPLGARAIAHGANPTAVAAADRTRLYANRHGILFTIGGHPNTITRSVRIADATGAQTDASIVGTIAAGTKVAVTAITVTCSKANTVNVAVKLGFGATSIPADSTTGADGVLLDHEGISPGSGVVVGNGSAILGIGADGEELRLTCDDPVGGFVIVTFSYFTIES
jgi:hypothetical protein